ncbi:MAG: arsenate reductase ArsC [Acidimicrobiales bacterium]
MSDTSLMTPGQRTALEHVAQDLQAKFKGVFGQETIMALLEDSFDELAATARIKEYLVVGAKRFATQRLKALVQAADQTRTRVPAVLFLCVHNAGRSQMALGWFTHLAKDRAIAWSGGSEPGSEINPSAVSAMAELGIDISEEFPKPMADEFIGAADVVVTMGCGDACPLLPGKRYEDWELEDPSEMSLEQIRPIRDEIGRRVEALLAELLPPPTL